MPKTIYISLSELTEHQIEIMNFVEWWVHNKKKPTPLKEIFIKMAKKGLDKNSTIYSVKILLQKGYIRRSLDGGGNSKTSFVQLRRI